MKIDESKYIQRRLFKTTVEFIAHINKSPEK